MAYVIPEFKKINTNLNIEIRGKCYLYTVTKLPFVQNRYVKRINSTE